MKLLVCSLGLLFGLSVACAHAQQSYPKPADPTSATPQFSAPMTITPLDASAISGAAITALIAGHATRGGWLLSAAIMCINLAGTATTTQGANVMCFAANTLVVLPPTNGAVSVDSSTAGSISGYGFN